MDAISKKDYLDHPCRASSLPYWKAKSMTIPDGMRIVHQDDFHEGNDEEYTDEPYFRLSHDLPGLSVSAPPPGFALCQADLCDFAAHINSCYDDVGISESTLQSYTQRPVYDSNLWLAVRDEQTGKIVATGIAELDREIGEGILEWIQVSKAYRGRGLGSYIVCELLRRMKGLARFATVSGQCDNPTNPEGLYRKCGFTGTDIWHILKKKA